MTSKNTFEDFHGSGWFWTAPIYVRNDCQPTVIMGNEFINVDGTPTAVYVRDLNNTRDVIRHSGYENSGLPGWAADTDGPAAVLLAGESNLVSEGNFPDGTTLDEQVLDPGTSNTVVASR